MRSLGWKWSQTTVWKVETGERALRLGEAVDLESVLGASLEVLGSGDGLDVSAARLEFRRALEGYRAAADRFEHARDRLREVAGDRGVLSAMATNLEEFNEAAPLLFTREETSYGFDHTTAER
jgi:hypothetical protein